MPTNDCITIYALFGFLKPVTIDLDNVDFEWLEGHADGCAYASTQDGLPIGLWLRSGYAAEIIDVGFAATDDFKVLRTWQP